MYSMISLARSTALGIAFTEEQDKTPTRELFNIGTIYCLDMRNDAYRIRVHTLQI